MKIFILVILCISGGLLIAQPVFALTISPPLYEIGAFPGQVLITGLKIFNETERTDTFYFEAQNFRAKENEESEPFFLIGKEKENLASWIEFPVESVTLDPGEKKTIDFKIKVPENADPGGHYAAIFLSSLPPTKEGEKTIGVASKIGALVLLRVEGDIREEGRLIEFRLKESKSFYEYPPVDFLVRFENTGTVHIKPAGRIEIKNLFGKKISEILVNIAVQPDGKEEPVSNVLPQSIRKFENSWTKREVEEMPKGFFEKLKYEKDNFAIGRYKADLCLEYGLSKKTAQGSLSFWVFPWRLLSVIGTGIVILLFFVIFSIRKYNRWIINKASQKIGIKKN